MHTVMQPLALLLSLDETPHAPAPSRTYQSIDMLSASAAATDSGDPIIAERGFEMVVLDEATQAPEPAALVAVAARVSAIK
jgi:hypothetical protein